METALRIAYERFQQLLENAMGALPSLLFGSLIVIAFIFAARTIKRLVQQSGAPRRHRNLALALGRLAQWGVLLLGVLIAVTVAFPTFTPADLISALGITGIAIGFAFKDILENFLAGILILITEPFRINDQIIVDNYEVTVENIETRATTIITYDGRRVIIPNAALFKSSLIINTAFDKRRMEYDVGIGSSDDIPFAKKLMLDAIRNVDGVLPDPVPDVLVVGFAPNGANIRMRWWINPPRRADALDVTDRVLEQVKKSLTSNGIDIPFPTHQVLFHDQTESTDGDRTLQREGWPPSRKGQPVPQGIAGAILAARRRRNRGGEDPSGSPQQGRRSS